MFRLTNGLNTITLHATDMAGNVTVTNFSLTLDYSSRTNPPLVNLYWPQNGTLHLQQQLHLARLGG